MAAKFRQQRKKGEEGHFAGTICVYVFVEMEAIGLNTNCYTYVWLYKGFIILPNYTVFSSFKMALAF